MKKTSLQFIPVALLVATSLTASGQDANRSLSNLTTTSINQNLFPNTDNTKNLGSTSKSWKNVYLDGALYLNGIPMAKAQPSASQTFYGWEAGNLNSKGICNSAFGYRALALNTTASYNSAFGLEALYANGSNSTSNNAFGYAALHRNNGQNNNAFGAVALYLNGSGSNNCAFGLYSLQLNNNGHGNAAFGNFSLQNNRSGSYNVAIGQASLFSSENNSHNIAIGDSALCNYNDGSYEDYMVGIGYNALKNNTTGFYNTGVGGLSLLNNKTGYHNTALGVFADVSAGDLYNATAIGYDTKVDASNKVRVGNTFVKSIGGQVGWTVFSDGRYKKNVQENVLGLAFINNLRPVTYTVDVKSVDKYYNKETNKKNDEKAASVRQKAEDEAGKIIYNGFIAQEVEEAANKLNYNFSGVDKPQGIDGLYGLRYSDFVVPLVKAVQELSKQNDELKKQHQLQQKEINELKAMVLLGKGTNNVLSTANDKQQVKIHEEAYLEQNTPNPFNQSTTIRYSLPVTVKSAKIVITDQTGKVLKQISISRFTKGTIHIDGGVLSSGTYHYSLIADDKLMDTKKMVFTK